jgi:hypothetical protein
MQCLQQLHGRLHLLLQCATRVFGLSQAAAAHRTCIRSSQLLRGLRVVILHLLQYLLLCSALTLLLQLLLKHMLGNQLQCIRYCRQRLICLCCVPA